MSKAAKETPDAPLNIEMIVPQLMPIDSIFPYDKNPRKITEDAIEAVASSIKEYGWQQDIVVDKNNVIVVGHTRLLAAKRLGLTEVPVRRAVNLTEKQAQAYRIIDNKSGEKALWDFDLLKGELSGLDLNTDVFNFNFTQFELDTILQADWDSVGQSDKDSEGNVGADPHVSHSVKLTGEQHDIWKRAIEIKKNNSDGAKFKEGDLLVEIAQEWINGWTE